MSVIRNYRSANICKQTWELLENEKMSTKKVRRNKTK